MKKLQQKKTDYLSWIILLSILSLTTFIAINMHTLKSELLEQSSTRVQVIDNLQFEELCNQLVTQWNSNDYIVYLYQPNSVRKTHKELASTSIDTNLPIRLEFYDSKRLNKNSIIFGKSEDLSFSDEIDIKRNKYYALIPVLNYNIVNAEIYVFFSEEKSEDKLRVMMSESQVLSRMLN